MNKLFHPIVCFLVRLVLGGSLIYASYHKIVDPGDFKKIVFNYKLFPAELINLIAIYMPWLEASVGVALITGIGKRGASIIAAGLFTSFIVILSYNLARECPTICGCFSTFAEGSALTVDEKFTEMHKEIWVVDVPSLLASFHVMIGACRERKKAAEAA